LALGGARFLLEARPDLVDDGLICGEGTGSMELAIAEKGVLWIEVEARVPSGQGMLMRRGSSATPRLAAMLGAIDDLNDQRLRPPAAVACLAANAGENGLRVSANIGIIEGGDFVSQVAPRATARVEFCVPSGLTPLKWRAGCRGWSPAIRGWPGDASRAVSPTGRPRTPARCAPWRTRPPPFAAGALGTSAVCYGLQPTLVAGEDDYANEEDMVDCAKVYARAALQFSNKHSLVDERGLAT
jgi:succinyl-diaminopimelate desuccinylase